jgi:GNAT superfamily N-acetyltransferase
MNRVRDAAVRVRQVRQADLEVVIALDAQVTGLKKADYWAELYRRYGTGRRRERQFLVAEGERGIDGFVIGDVRDWEFGSPACGWVFAINVRPGARQAGIGSRLLEAVCEEFRKLGVTTVRTLLARDNNLVLSFFRARGMMAAQFIPLEMELDA